ncbi:MAG: glycoside hydrolase family 3 N-terminal domain-containing protein [Myxococcota bacterium]
MKLHHLAPWFLCLVAIGCTRTVQVKKGTIVSQDATGKPDVLRQKIGQLLLMGFDGTSIQDQGVQDILHSISRGEVGGVILFRHNITGPAQLKQLMKALRTAVPQGFPDLFVAIDQEGGKVCRMSSQNGFTDFPSPKQMAQQNLQDACSSIAKLVAEYGFNVNFTPVVDLDLYNAQGSVIGGLERSFSPDPQIVIQYAAQCIKAHQKEGVLPVEKHYPGHGSAKGNTHEGYVNVTDDWQPQELLPYKQLHEMGLLAAVMTAHVVNRNVDLLPASLSRVHIQDMLREKIGHQGLVFSDDLQMGAVSGRYELAHVARMGMHAGVDVLVFSNNPLACRGVETLKYGPRVQPKQVVDAIEQHIFEGDDTLRQRVEESYQRVVRVKESLKRQKNRI